MGWKEWSKPDACDQDKIAYELTNDIKTTEEVDEENKKNAFFVIGVIAILAVIGFISGGKKACDKENEPVRRMERRGETMDDFYDRIGMNE